MAPSIHSLGAFAGEKSIIFVHTVFEVREECMTANQENVGEKMAFMRLSHIVVLYLE